MNAVMREKYEAPVITNETIEVSIASLRAGVDDVKADVRELKADYRTLRDKVDQHYDVLSRGQIALRDKLDDTRSELSGRIEQVRTELGSEIKQVRVDLSGEIKQVRADLGDEIKQVRTDLGDEIKQVRTDLGDEIKQVRADLGNVRTELGGQIGQVRTELGQVSKDQKTLREALEKKIEEGDSKLGTKIDQLFLMLSQTNVCVAKVATTQKTLFWVISGLASLGALIPTVLSLGARFHWF